MVSQLEVTKRTDIFAALVVSVGSMLVGEVSDRMLSDLVDAPQADLGPGLLRAALEWLREDPEMLGVMAESALKTALAILNQHFGKTS